jgi:hypothetical protein
VHCRHVPRRAVIRMLFYSLVPVALCGGQVHPGVESCAHIGTVGREQRGRCISATGGVVFCFSSCDDPFFFCCGDCSELECCDIVKFL